MKDFPLINRAVNKNHYTKVSNDLIRGESLSALATVILIYALSNSENWSVTKKHIKARFPDLSWNGIKKAFNELEARGFAYCECSSVGKANITMQWSFFENPLPEHERSNETCWKKPEPKKNWFSSQRNESPTGPLNSESDESTTIKDNLPKDNYTIKDNNNGDIVSCYKDERDYELRRNLFGGILR